MDAPTAGKSASAAASQEGLKEQAEPAQTPTPGAQKPSPAAATTTPTSMVGVLAGLLVQMKQRQATEDEMRPIVDAMAQLLAAGALPVVLPNPTTPASPPPPKNAPEAKDDGNQAASAAPAVPAACPAVKTETASPNPRTTVAAPEPCNSKTHASEYKAFTRFIESNSNAVEIRKAFEPDPELLKEPSHIWNL